jgi:hypothetical protein
MYRRELEHRRKEAILRAALVEASDAAWGKCAEAAKVMLTLRARDDFDARLGGYMGLFDTLQAALLAMRGNEHADAVLHLAVARAALRPMLSKVEALGWLAHEAPQGLVWLLALVAADDGSWPRSGMAAPLVVPCGRRR